MQLFYLSTVLSSPLPSLKDTVGAAGSSIGETIGDKLGHFIGQKAGAYLGGTVGPMIGKTIGGGLGSGVGGLIESQTGVSGTDSAAAAEPSVSADTETTGSTGAGTVPSANVSDKTAYPPSAVV